MNEIEEYYYLKSNIESIKTTLVNLGYEYSDRKGWYKAEYNKLSNEQERLVKIGMEKFPKMVKRLNELTEILNLK